MTFNFQYRLLELSGHIDNTSSAVAHVVILPNDKFATATTMSLLTRVVGPWSVVGYVSKEEADEAISKWKTAENGCLIIDLDNVERLALRSRRAELRHNSQIHYHYVGDSSALSESQILRIKYATTDATRSSEYTGLVRGVKSIISGWTSSFDWGHGAELENVVSLVAQIRDTGTADSYAPSLDQESKLILEIRQRVLQVANHVQVANGKQVIVVDSQVIAQTLADELDARGVRFYLAVSPVPDHLKGQCNNWYADQSIAVLIVSFESLGAMARIKPVFHLGGASEFHIINSTWSLRKRKLLRYAMAQSHEGLLITGVRSGHRKMLLKAWVKGCTEDDINALVSDIRDLDKGNEEDGREEEEPRPKKVAWTKAPKEDDEVADRPPFPPYPTYTSQAQDRYIPAMMHAIELQAQENSLEDNSVRTLVVVDTLVRAKYMVYQIQAQGVTADTINADMLVKDRIQLLNDWAAGVFSTLVVTRGMVPVDRLILASPTLKIYSAVPVIGNHRANLFGNPFPSKAVKQTIWRTGRIPNFREMFSPSVADTVITKFDITDQMMEAEPQAMKLGEALEASGAEIVESKVKNLTEENSLLVSELTRVKEELETTKQILRYAAAPWGSDNLGAAYGTRGEVTIPERDYKLVLSYMDRLEDLASLILRTQNGDELDLVLARKIASLAKVDGTLIGSDL